MTVDQSTYNINIRKGIIEGENLYEARVKELVDIVAYAGTASEAYDLAIDAIEVTAEHFTEIGKAMPEPSIPVDDYSGRVTLRIPRSLHKSLADAAVEERSSLNQYIVSMLSYCSGITYGQKTAFEGSWVSFERDKKQLSKAKDTRHLKLIYENNQIARA